MIDMHRTRTSGAGISRLALFAGGLASLLALSSCGKSGFSLSAKTTFDDRYAVEIKPLLGEADSCLFADTLSPEGSFEWRSVADAPLWVEVSFFPVARDRQLGATFPLYLTPGEGQSLDLSYSDSTYLELGEGGRISPENRALIRYATFINRMQRDWFVRQPKGDEIVAMAGRYVSFAEELLETEQVKEPEVRSYLDVRAHHLMLGALIHNHPDSLSVIPKEIVKHLDNELLLTSYDGIPTLNRYLTLLTNTVSEAQPGSLDFLRDKTALTSERITTAGLRDRLLASDVEHFIRGYRVTDLPSLEADLAGLRDLFSASDLPASVQEPLLSRFEALSYTLEGSSLPDVTFRDLEGKEQRLDRFAGSYLYIDLWASWCGPCIRQLPDLKALAKLAEGKPFAIVSLSIDEDPEAWKAKVAELGLTGNQWHAGDSGFADLMNVTGIPHFLLYDQAGKLLYYNAPRPGTSEMIDFVNKL